ncbi:hypothetical protein [Xenophilus sp. Marseille-Q4582]|uniref:hypothetical protein n=1 Tax=Xenophilus sp. Marseille-Q4582 TaxID=2866600 RepID=UPI001CE4722B|nr:hypothetical protein [Xenophilus sp. Marseille-Q4582]
MSGARALCWPAPHSPWQLALGFSVWSLWFVVAYVGLSLGCAMAPPPAGPGAFTALNLGLSLWTVATVGMLLAAAWVCLRAWRAARAPGPHGPAGAARRRFMAGLSALLHLAAAGATVFVGLPLVWLPPCL